MTFQPGHQSEETLLLLTLARDWMEADRPLKHQAENVKKNNKETLWTFISWRKLLKLKTSKAIPGRETLRKNILGFGHTQKKILKCVLSYKKQSTWWQETNTKLCIYIYTALLKHNNSTHW